MFWDEKIQQAESHLTDKELEAMRIKVAAEEEFSIRPADQNR